MNDTNESILSLALYCLVKIISVREMHSPYRILEMSNRASRTVSQVWRFISCQENRHRRDCHFSLHASQIKTNTSTPQLRPIQTQTKLRRTIMDDFRPTSSSSHHPNPEELLSPLEQEVLDEYAKLVGNLDDVYSQPASHSRNMQLTHG